MLIINLSLPFVPEGKVYKKMKVILSNKPKGSELAKPWAGGGLPISASTVKVKGTSREICATEGWNSAGQRATLTALHNA